MQRFARGGHCHIHVQRTDDQLNLDVHSLADFEANFLHGRRKSGSLGLDFIFVGQEGRRFKVSVVIRSDAANGQGA